MKIATANELIAMEYVIIFLLVAVIICIWYIISMSNKSVKQDLLVKELTETVEQSHKSIEELELSLQESAKQNRDITSRKISSEVRLGGIAEQISPFLKEFPHNPKDCRFLGSPTDFIAFDFETPAVYFIEIKTGNAKENKRQKQIKKAIKENKVYYQQMRIGTDKVTITQDVKDDEEDNVKSD